LTVFLFCIVVWFPWSARAFTADVCVLVSREIRPFLLMADELENNLKFSSKRIYLDSTSRPYEENGNFLDIVESDYNLFVAVGPRALSYLLERVTSTRIIHSMVLNPESFIKGRDEHITGVSLNIFSLTQLGLIKKVFPDIERVGVLYDPEHNRNWFNSARFLANAQKIDLVPLVVSDRTQISNILDQKASSLDVVLFIPDATVISTTIIQHVIKQLLLKKIPAIGYNSFFVEAGAAMSFVMDYPEMGRHVANVVHKHLNDKKRVPVGSLFRVIVNARVLDLLELKMNNRLPENIEIKE